MMDEQMVTAEQVVEDYMAGAGRKYERKEPQAQVMPFMGVR